MIFNLGMEVYNYFGGSRKTLPRASKTYSIFNHIRVKQIIKANLGRKEMRLIEDWKTPKHGNSWFGNLNIISG